MKKDSTGKIAVLVDERIVLLENDSDHLYLESFEGKCKIKTMTDEYIVSESLVVWRKNYNERNLCVFIVVSS